MAQRRMFSLKVIDTDLFLDMPISARLLYYDLSMRADDDGFVSSPKKIQRMIGCSDDDFKLLIAKQFIIPFESGVCVIKHWRIHNYIRIDRYTETIYKDEKQELIEDDGKYEIVPFSHDTPNDIPNDIPLVTQMDTQVRLGKDRLEEGKDSLEKEKGKSSKETIKTLVDAYASDGGELNKALYDFIEMRKTIKKQLTPRALKTIITKLDGMATDDYTKIKILEQSIEHSWQTVYPLKDSINMPKQQMNNEMLEWVNS